MLLLCSMFDALQRRRARAAVAAGTGVVLIVATLVATSGSAAASVRSDHSRIVQLEQRIAARGAEVQSLVSRYDQVQGHLNTLDAQIAAGQAHLAADHRAEDSAKRVLRQVAIAAYVTDMGMAPPSVSVLGGTGSVTTALEQTAYLDAANGKLGDALAALHTAEHQTEVTQAALQAARAQAAATLRDLTAAHKAAQAAIASDEAMLTHINGNLRALLVAAAARRRAAQAAAEQQLASTPPPAPPVTQPPPTTTTTTTTTAPAQTPTTTTPPPPPPPPPPSPGGYANPLRAVSGLSAERIDQGVDYGGFGPIYAAGDGVVLSTVNSGWPGGTFIAYRLTDGPASGLVVYAAEDIEPSVQVGATVTPNTVLGQMYAGPDGIETGWADGSALGETMAMAAGQFSGSNSTAFGNNFSQLLQSLGAPGGILQNNPPTGTLPPSWPQW